MSEFKFSIVSKIVEYVTIEADSEHEARKILDGGYQADSTENLNEPEVKVIYEVE